METLWSVLLRLWHVLVPSRPRPVTLSRTAVRRRTNRRIHLALGVAASFEGRVFEDDTDL